MSSYNTHARVYRGTSDRWGYVWRVATSDGYVYAFTGWATAIAFAFRATGPETQVVANPEDDRVH